VDGSRQGPKRPRQWCSTPARDPKQLGSLRPAPTAAPGYLLRMHQTSATACPAAASSELLGRSRAEIPPARPTYADASPHRPGVLGGGYAEAIDGQVCKRA